MVGVGVTLGVGVMVGVTDGVAVAVGVKVAVGVDVGVGGSGRAAGRAVMSVATNSNAPIMAKSPRLARMK